MYIPEAGNTVFWNNFSHFPFHMPPQNNSNKVHSLSNNISADKIKLTPPNRMQIKS